jgi:hypothetical protein
VISDKHVNRAASKPGPVANVDDEVEHFSVFIASSDNVSELNDNQTAANPIAIFVNTAGQAKSIARGANVCMEVSYGDDPPFLA